MESVLSPELIEELGGLKESDNPLIVPSKDKKRKSEKIEVNEDFIQEAKRMSKKAKKRFEQFQRREEKNKKKDEYLNVLQKYVISDQHRGLMTSTRDIGQMNTLKKQLSKIFKRYQAGLSLTDEEKELLFPNGESIPSIIVEEVTSTEENVNTTFQGNDVISVEDHIDASNSISVTCNNDNDENVLLDVFNLTSDDTQVVSSNKSKKTKKAKENSSKLVLSSSEKQVESTIGLNLLSQLKNLKSNSSILEKTIKNESFDDKSKDSEFDILNHVSDKSPYIPIVMEKPVNDFSSIIKLDTNIKKTVKPLTIKKHVHIIRNSKIQEQRLQLPVCAMEQEIVEAISSNDVVILCGETGSGKSTQVPQFLYEAGYAMNGLIGITQPRRVAAVSTAQRVSVELGCGEIQKDSSFQGVVGYQIRFDSFTVHKDTRIKFMTDGILLREITENLSLRKYNVILLDEAHERSINTDILLGMISRSIQIRKTQSLKEQEKWNKLSPETRQEYDLPIKPLKLVIMSATLRVEDFCNPILFPISPPIINVEARQYPVVTHFSKKTELRDYFKEAHKKVCQIHRKLPEGGVLLFLTGKREVLSMCRRLEKSLNKSSHVYSFDEDEDNVDEGLLNGIDYDDNDSDIDGTEDDVDDIDDDIDDDLNQNSLTKKPHTGIPTTDEEDTVENDSLRENMLLEVLGMSTKFQDDQPLLTSGDLSFSNSVNDSNHSHATSKALILPLFAMMSQEQQQRVFQQVPDNHRLIIVSTNVAETSITIPGVRYVVDCGRQKERIVNAVTGVSKFEICWISKASAEQRKGRAGRTGPGHCYRLYSSSFFDQHMKLFRPPDILTAPLEDLLLQMRAMGISDVNSFPFPTSPPKDSLQKALNLLTYLGAILKPKMKKQSMWNALLSTKSQSNAKTLFRENGQITELGRSMGKIPINPRYAKILIMADRAGILVHAIALISILSDKSPFTLHSTSRPENEDDVSDEEENESDKDKHLTLRQHPHGDALAYLRAFGAYSFFLQSNPSTQQRDKFCQEYGLNQAILQKAFDLQRQLTRTCHTLFSSEKLMNLSKPPSKHEEVGLRQVLMTGFCDSIARKAPIGYIANLVKSQLDSSNTNNIQLSRRKKLTAYLSCNPSIQEPLYIHPHSNLYPKNPADDLPEFIMYSSLLKNDKGDCTYMIGVSVIQMSWIASLTIDCPLLKWSEPLESPSPFYDKESDTMMCYVTPTYGSLHWELPTVKKSFEECIQYQITNTTSEIPENTSTMIGYRKYDIIYRWFARLLLEGMILTELRIILNKTTLKESCVMITQMKPLPKISSLLQELIQEHVVSKRKLKEVLSRDPNYLMNSIQVFLKPEERKQFRNLWIHYANTCNDTK